MDGYISQAEVCSSKAVLACRAKFLVAKFGHAKAGYVNLVEFRLLASYLERGHNVQVIQMPLSFC